MKKIFYEKMPAGQEVAFHIDSSDYNILHTHEYFEFALTREGSILHFVNKEKYIVNKMQVILLAPKNEHRMKNNCSSKRFNCLDLQITKEKLRLICELIGVEVYEKVLTCMPYCFKLSDLTMMQVQEYIEKALYYHHTDKERQYILTSIVFMIISEFAREQFWERQYNENKTHKAIELFFDQLNDKNNISKSFAEICELIPYHRSHIMRIFKQKGMGSPNQWLIKHKMNYAANLLRTTDMKVIDISNAIGYSSIAYFNKIFKAEYGCTPSEYRK